MSEAPGRTEMERRLIERSLDDPKAVVEQEFGTRLPEDLRLVTVEETADTIYLMLPSTSPVGEGGGLADRELEAVAGGDAGSTSSFSLCNISCDPNCMY